jgi:hypothetical protein
VNPDGRGAHVEALEPLERFWLTAVGFIRCYARDDVAGMVHCRQSLLGVMHGMELTSTLANFAVNDYIKARPSATSGGEAE